MKILIYLLGLFSLCAASAQNGLQEGNYFLLQNSNVSLGLNSLENNMVVEYQDFKISEKSIHTTDQKARVAILDTATNKISLYDIRSSKTIELSIPYELKSKTLLLNDHNLFIGGILDKEMLVQYHIESGQWHQLEIPKEVMLPGKAVDDLLVTEEYLIAVDDLIMPKYLLFYHLKAQGRLEFSHKVELKSNGTYESIHQGGISADYLGLISGTNSGYTGASEHISIYDRHDLSRSFALSANERDNSYHSFNDFLLYEDWLYIASKEKGFGKFRIRDSYFKVSEDEVDIFHTAVPAQKIRYTSYGDEEITRLTKIPGHRLIILTIRNSSGEIHHDILKL